MIELAEPLLNFGGGGEKKEEKKGAANAIANVEPCELHFIRCIKPNDVKKRDTFIDSMCLQ